MGGWISGSCSDDGDEGLVVLEPSEPGDDEPASLLQLLAEQSDGKLVEIAKGWFYESKLPPAGHRRGEMPSDREPGR
jgi:hypothetical protein